MEKFIRKVYCTRVYQRNFTSVNALFNSHNFINLHRNWAYIKSYNILYFILSRAQMHLIHVWWNVWCIWDESKFWKKEKRKKKCLTLFDEVRSDLHVWCIWVKFHQTFGILSLLWVQNIKDGVSIKRFSKFKYSKEP